MFQSSSMGSALSSMVRMMMRRQGGAPPAFVHDLHCEVQTLQERSMCGCGEQSALTPCRQRTEEERDASIIGHVHHALRRYNADNPGSEFVPVKPLMAAYVGFQGYIWVHVSFVARGRRIVSGKRRRSTVSDTVTDNHFFAELRYSHRRSDALAVETCTIIDKPSRHSKTACAFCPESFEISHPLDGSFLCGRKSQANEGQGFTHFMNLLEKPFTCPTASGEGEGKEDVAAPEEQKEEDSSTMSSAFFPFDFLRNLITRVILPAFDDKICALE